MAADFRRKNIRLPRQNYIGRRLYFVTLCFSNRRRVGANPRVASWLIEQLQPQSAACGFLVHAYCVMPDHMHLLIHGMNPGSDLLKFMDAFKKDTGFRFNADSSKRLWQYKYYDHIVRASQSADAIAWYIWMNPVRKGLCRAPRDHPFSGSFTEIGTTMFHKPSAQKWTPPWKTAP
jgi:putative transposase